MATRRFESTDIKQRSNTRSCNQQFAKLGGPWVPGYCVLSPQAEVAYENLQTHYRQKDTTEGGCVRWPASPMTRLGDGTIGLVLPVPIGDIPQ